MSNRPGQAPASRDSGASLVEVLVTVAIIAIVLVVFISALSTGCIGVRVSSRRTTATNLAAVQLESIKSEAYDAAGGYGIVDRPTDYGIVLTTNVITAGLQQVTVTVSYDGETLIELSDYKVYR
jgi:type II secretory pathway pseudopilin PulG